MPEPQPDPSPRWPFGRLSWPEVAAGALLIGSGTALLVVGNVVALPWAGALLQAGASYFGARVALARHGGPPAEPR